MENQSRSQDDDPIADYEFWFSKEKWDLQEAAALVVGLNPSVVLNPQVRLMYEKNDIAGDANYRVWHPLWKYSEEAIEDWYKILDKSDRFIEGSRCASEMDDVIDEHQHVRPMDFMQWCTDQNVRMHYSLVEYLQSIGYDFRFSKNSKILNELQIYARKDIWFMPFAARLVFGLSPDASKIYLQNRKNLYRHHDANYTLTQRDEVYHIMELALESWKTKNLEFIEIHGDDPEDGYFSEENCGVSVEAKKFVDWAIKKGLNPPEQLLEFMGLRERQEQNVDVRNAAIMPTYCTPDMKLMFDAIEKFWKDYDLNDPDPGKAPYKKDVVGWLTQEAKDRKITDFSQTRAETLDTIIRCPSARRGGNTK